MKVLLLLLCLLSLGVFSADDTAPNINYSKRELPKVSTRQSDFKKSFFRIAGTAALWKYEEPNVMKESGPFYGGELLYNFHNIRQQTDLDVKVSFILSNETKYDGALFDGTAYKFTDKNRIFFIRTNYYLKHFRPRARLIYGLQFRRLVNPDVASSPYDYRREQDYFTFNFGTRLTLLSRPKSSLNVDLNAHFLLVGKNRTFLLGPGITPFELKQGFGKGFGLEVNADYYVSHFFIGLTFNYWNIADSEVIYLRDSKGNVGGLLEPKNNTLHGNLHVGVRF